MLVNMKQMLAHAQKEKYAVPAFDIVENHMIRSILDTAEREKSPIILMGHGIDLEGFGMDYISGMVKGVAHKYSVPICLHLDHSTDFELIKRAIAHGFTSVMYDGSALPLEENIANTKKVVDYAHQYNVTVEGELGHVAGKMLDGSEDEQKVQLTEPDEVKRFIEETNVDALAISIGTAHGVYESLPELDIDRLKDIAKVTDVPLVLHGGSGTPAEQLNAAFQHGITKLNIAADLRVALRNGYEIALAEHPRPDALPYDLHQTIDKVFSKTVAEKFKLLGSNQRY